MDVLGMSSMASAPRASQLSSSATFPSTNSSTSVNSLSTAATLATAPNGQVMATSNIINQRADASRSLSTRYALAKVPGFEGYMHHLEEMATDPDEGGPVESLWKLLRTGYPLLAIYNALQPETPLQVQDPPGASEAKRSKIAILRFVEACKSKLMLPTTEVFIITDLAGNDTTGFVKVTSVINHVLDLAEQRGLLLEIQPYPEDDTMQVGSQMSYRDYVVRELVDTERKYVQDLENLHDLKKTLEQNGIIPGDVVHNIFLNINAILDCQRKFLIRVETTNSIPPSRQEWGKPVCCRKAGHLASQVFDKIQAAEHPVACDLNTLDGFLLKPMQRLVKYPLLLKDLLKKSEDDATKDDLMAGIDAAERVLQKANEVVDRDLLDEAVEDLVSRVEDWKKHRVDQFGKLLLHGVYTVNTGKTEQEKDYEIYLFECILLCCKEVVPGKTKDKKDKTRSTGPKMRNRNAKLQLKGRIFMTNVTDVISRSKPGLHTVQVCWKGDPGVESFTIKFQNEETLKKWTAGLNQQRAENAPEVQRSDEPAPTFTYFSAMGTSGLENPYAQQPDSDDEDDVDGSIGGTTAVSSQYAPSVPIPGTMSRNASSTNLRRQRSATGESTHSIAGIARAGPPRFPMIPPNPLSVQVPSQASPMPRPGDSYFSPTADSPASSRASTTSGIFVGGGYPFPQKVGTPQPRNMDDNNRYTAPAMPRQPSRDGSSPANAFGANGRNPRGPSMPVMGRPEANASQLQQQRSRSHSTPDINGQAARNGGSIPNVPNIGMPNQLKVKVNYDGGNYFTLVAQFNITYQSLVDRIDVKLARLTNSSIARGDLKLRYRDEDGDFVTIESDDDIQIAISEWREGQGGMPGGLGEIELFCVGEMS
ncbi:Guanine nucleotide exchange factor for Cdc42p [Collariella sp. IMI 366227]|nr:Guanine nucleotide exchange factor for Cdc42p [Collariella sp. IMI 366227]